MASLGSLLILWTLLGDVGVRTYPHSSAIPHKFLESCPEYVIKPLLRTEGLPTRINPRRLGQRNRVAVPWCQTIMSPVRLCWVRVLYTFVKQQQQACFEQRAAGSCPL